MFQKQKNNDKGFTIIEVLIVLAIAGLILLIVFLAVPALQRNSRNTQYRSEASQLLGAYGEVSSNKSSQVLTASTSTSGGTTDADKVLAAANTRNITVLKIQAHAASSDITAIAPGTAPTTNQVNTATVIIRTGAKCSAADSGTGTAGNLRQVALYYVVETAGSQQIQCQDS